MADEERESKRRLIIQEPSVQNLNSPYHRGKNCMSGWFIDRSQAVGIYVDVRFDLGTWTKH